MDGDGISNGDDNCVNVINREQADLDGDGQGDVCDSDVDGDGLNDVEEVLLGTDPRDADTDDDGLNDLFEQRGQTNPLQADSDGDGTPDGVGWARPEQAHGYRRRRTLGRGGEQPKRQRR